VAIERPPISSGRGPIRITKKSTLEFSKRQYDMMSHGQPMVSCDILNSSHSDSASSMQKIKFKIFGHQRAR